uniref:Uncharacterized protein n=1 Tax=Rhizophora mucronata TaxID=61149 RepID=A0A2P2N9J4_RHIMU
MFICGDYKTRCNRLCTFVV